MPAPSIGKIVAIAAALALGVILLAARGRVPLPDQGDAAYVPAKKKRRRLMAFGVACLWLFSGLVLGMFQTEARELTVTISPARVELWGWSISSSVIAAWIVIAVLAIAAVLVRIFVIPNFKETPRGLQSVLEAAVGAVSDFTRDKFGHRNEGLASYFFALAALFIGSAVIELFGLRPPTTDLTMTLSYAFITFIMINYWGIRKKGLAGRVKSYTQPSAIVLPFKLLSDIAIPVSLACRLFGNMLAGMIVVELIYYAMGAFSIGVPAVLGLYFNAFHPIIQFFIFINLSLTFIGEAVE